MYVQQVIIWQPIPDTNQNGVVWIAGSERVLDISIRADKAAELYGPIRIHEHTRSKANG